MSNDGFIYRDKKKKVTLTEELQNQFVQEQGLTSFDQFDPRYHTKTQKGYQLSRKLEGLELFQRRVKAQGAVVAADMLTAKMKSEYERDYGLSSKELERMLGEMQQGYVEDFQMEEHEYERIQTKIRSDYSRQTHADHSKIYEELGEVLYEKRKAQNMPSFQLVTLEGDAAKDFIKRHHLSEKELKKIYLDIQTHAVSVEKYRTYSTIEEETREQKKAAEKKREAEERKQQEINRAAEEIRKQQEKQRQLQEQRKREDPEKRRVRRLYLETGVTLQGTPDTWPIGMYADAAEKYLAEMKNDVLDMKEVEEAVKEMQENLLKNRRILVKELQELIKTYEDAGLPLFLAKQITDELAAAFEQKHIRGMFGQELVAVINETVKAEKFLSVKEEQLKHWSQRGKRIRSEIGKDRIDLSAMKNDTLENLYRLSEEEFEKQVKLLSKQVDFNLSHVDRVIEEQLTVVNRERLFRQIQEKHGELLIFGAPVEIYDTVHNYIENMTQEMRSSEENAARAIESFQLRLSEAIVEFGVSDYGQMDYTVWEKLVKKTIEPDDSLETMEKKLQYLAVNMAANLEKFKRTYSNGTSMPPSVWNDLYEYRNTILDAKPKDFPGLIRKKLDEELLAKFRKEDGSYDYGAEEETDFERHYFFWCAIDELDDSIMYKENFTNIERLKGRELLKHPEFEFAFREREEMFLSVLYEALEEGALELDCLKDIRHYQDLDLLSYSDMEMVLHLIRTNIRGCARRWGNIIGVFASEIQESILKDMIRGRLKAEEIEERIELEKEKVTKIHPKIRKIRTRFLLSVDEKASRSNVGVEKLPEDCYYVRNREKFADAKRTWEILKEAGLEYEALSCCMKYCQNPYKEDFGRAMEENPAGPLKQLLDNKIGTREAKRLADKLSRGRSKNFMHEMLWCGMEERFLNKDMNPFLYEIMTKPRQNNEKDDQDREAAADILRNMYRITDTINELGLTSSDKEYEEYRRKVIPSAMAFVDRYRDSKVRDANWGAFKTQQELELRQTGVADIWELCEQIKLHHSKRDAKRGFWQDIHNKELHEDKLLENHIESYRFLREYENGILDPVIPDLIKEDEFWISMATQGKEEFKDKIDKMTAKIRLPLEIIKERFSALGSEFYEEICGRFGKIILQGQDYDKVKWLETFDHFFKDYSERRLGGFSIVDLTAKLKKANSGDPVIPYVTEILLNHKDGIALAARPEELKEVLNKHRKNIEPNLELLKKEIDRCLDESSEEFGRQDKAEKNRKEIFRKGCLMYMQTKVIYTEPAEFGRRLAGWMEQYRKLQADMLEDNQKVDEEMERRREKLADIMEHRDAGIQADGRDFTVFRELKKGMRRSGSPLQMVLGRKSQAMVQEINKAKESIKHNFSDMPQAVQDYLFERSLSEVDNEVLWKEAGWLREVYQLAKIQIEQLTEEEKGQISDPEKLISEILLYSYIKQLKAQKMDQPAESDLIRKNYEELKHRHGRLSSLLDQKYTRTMEYQPVYRIIQEDPHEIKKVRENTVLSAQRHLVMEAMAAGLYSMDEKEFEELVGRQEVFLRNAQMADTVFEKAVKESNIDEKNRIAMRQALIDYFRADLMKEQGINVIELQEQVDKLLKDEVYRNGLLSTVLMEGEDDSMLLGNERTMITVANRKTFEDYLGLHRNNGYRQRYNELTRLQRQVFALVVLKGEEDSVLPGMKFVVSDELREVRSIRLAKDLEDYVKGRPFFPEISYDKVMDRLQNANGTLNQKVFSEAISLTEEYTRQRQRTIPKNVKLLNDSAYTLREVNRLLKQERELEEPEITEPQQLQTWILNQDKDKETDKRDGERILQTKERLKNLNDFQLRQLALVLNDRTMVDHSTDITIGEEETVFVNEEKRRRFREYDSARPRVSVATLQKAAKMLQGYQLRDEGKPVYGHLTEKDFAPEALKRKTKIDWKLMTRAMDLVKEATVQ